MTIGDMAIERSKPNLANEQWQKAAGHVESIRALIDAASRRAELQEATDIDEAAFSGVFSVSIHLLIGYSFELLLKAACLHNGGSEKSLRAIGHDLTKAYNGATSLGFESKAPELLWILTHLRKPHLTNEFRYGTNETVPMPPFSASLPALDVLVAEVGELVAPDFRLRMMT